MSPSLELFAPAAPATAPRLGSHCERGSAPRADVISVTVQGVTLILQEKNVPEMWKTLRAVITVVIKANCSR